MFSSQGLLHADTGYSPPTSRILAGSFSNPESEWIRNPLGQSFRIEAGQMVHRKGKKT